MRTKRYIPARLKCKYCNKYFDADKGVPVGIPEYCSESCFHKGEKTAMMSSDLPEPPAAFYKVYAVSGAGFEKEIARMFMTAPIPEALHPMSGLDVARFLMRDMGANELMHVRLMALAKAVRNDPAAQKEVSSLSKMLLEKDVVVELKAASMKSPDEGAVMMRNPAPARRRKIPAKIARRAEPRGAERSLFRKLLGWSR